MHPIALKGELIFKQTLNTLNKTSALLVDLIGGSASNIDSVQSKLPARNSIMLHTEKVVQVLGLTY